MRQHRWLIPIETQNYDPVKAPEEYVAQAAAYTSSGFLFIEAGCRGKEAGAPAGVADLKAAIRYLRYSSAEIPGNKDRIFVYGTGSGGALGEVLAASGNSALYTPYLEAIGAAGDVSDAVAGVYETDAVTGMDYADAAAEWMRETSEESEGTESTDVSGKAGLSRGLAVSYALYINQLGLVDEEGEPLLLSASEEGVYQDGTYCGYLKKVIEEALTQYLKEQDDRASCIQELNQDTEWVAYDEETGEAKVLNLQGYQELMDKKQTASEKTVGAFDSLEGDQTENILFGYGDGEGAHFDQVLAKLLQRTAPMEMITRRICRERILRETRQKPESISTTRCIICVVFTMDIRQEMWPDTGNFRSVCRRQGKAFLQAEPIWHLH